MSSGPSSTSTSWHGIVAVVLALAVAVGFVISVARGDATDSLPTVAVWALGGSVIGGLLTWLVSERTRD